MERQCLDLGCTLKFSNKPCNACKAVKTLQKGHNTVIIYILYQIAFTQFAIA